MKILQPVNLGAVIASVVLVSGHVSAAEPDATEGKNLSTVEAPESVKALAAKKTTPDSPESTSTGYDLYHTIVKGENLSELAKRFTGDGSNWKAIAEANKLDDKGTVHPGQIIRIPAALNKVAIESVPPKNSNDTKIAEKTKPEAETPEKTVTVPASFKGKAPDELPQ